MNDIALSAHRLSRCRSQPSNSGRNVNQLGGENSRNQERGISAWPRALAYRHLLNWIRIPKRSHSGFSGRGRSRANLSFLVGFGKRTGPAIGGDSQGAAARLTWERARTMEAIATMKADDARSGSALIPAQAAPDSFFRSQGETSLRCTSPPPCTELSFVPKPARQTWKLPRSTSPCSPNSPKSSEATRRPTYSLLRKECAMSAPSSYASSRNSGVKSAPYSTLPFPKTISSICLRTRPGW